MLQLGQQAMEIIDKLLTQTSGAVRDSVNAKTSAYRGRTGIGKGPVNVFTAEGVEQ